MTAVVPTTPNNGVLSTVQDFANIVGSVGEKAAGIYSSFLSANTTKALANAQAANQANAAQFASLNAAANKNNAISLLVYAGVGLAVLGAAMIIIKKVK